MWSRCGHSALRWLKRLSIQAWSVGVPGRPKCCAIAHMAMNSRVAPLVICGPLSLTASRIGGNGASTRARAAARPRAPGGPRRARAALRARARPVNATWTCVPVSSPETTSQIHLRVTRSMTVTTATPRAAGEVRRVVDPDRVARVARPLRKRAPLGPPRPPRRPQNQAVCSQNAHHRRRRDPHPARVGAAVRELAMRAIDLAPLVKERQDLASCSASSRPCTACPPAGRSSSAPASRRSRQRHARASPSSRYAHARRCSQPAAVARSISSSTPAFVAASTRRGTGPLSPNALFPRPASTGRPSPSAPPRAARSPPRAATSSGSTAPAFTPGRDADSASNAPCLATWRSFITVERSTPARSAASRIVLSPRTRPSHSSYFSDGDKNRLRRRLPLLAACPGSVILKASSSERPSTSQMRSDQNPDLSH